MKNKFIAIYRAQGIVDRRLFTSWLSFVVLALIREPQCRPREAEGSSTLFPKKLFLVHRNFLFEFSRLVHIQLPFIANPTNRCGRLRGITTLSLLTFLLMRTQAHPFLSRRISNSRPIPCNKQGFRCNPRYHQATLGLFSLWGILLKERTKGKLSQSSYRSVALVSEKQPGIGEGAKQLDREGRLSYIMF